jgi:hypothetical protein
MGYALKIDCEQGVAKMKIDPAKHIESEQGF